MHAPAHSCRALYRLHPQLRFAWVGRAPAYDGEENPGSFALVQLYHYRDCGSPEDPLSYREFYDVGVRPDPWGNAELGRVVRGPIFARDGGLRRDWDPLIRTPMLIAVLEGLKLQDEWCDDDGEDYSHYDVYSGRVVHTVRQWLLSPYDRYVKTAKEKGKKLRGKVQDIAHEGTKKLWKDANRSDAASVTLAKKHAKEDVGVQQFRKWQEAGGSTSLENTYMPPPPPKVSA